MRTPPEELYVLTAEDLADLTLVTPEPETEPAEG